MLRRLIDRLAARDLTTVLHTAEERVRERLGQRPPLPMDALVDACELPREWRAQARALLERLGEALQIDPGRLRPHDRFGELFRVTASELDNAAAETLDRHRVGRSIEVFGHDIMHVVEAGSNAGAWKAQQATLNPAPRNEDEWIDAIMGMSLRDFARFFAPTVVLSTRDS